MKAVLQRLGGALRRWPDRDGWRQVAIELAWGMPAIALVAWLAGNLTLAPVTDAGAIVTTVTVIFFIPALGEELLFRGALLFGDRATDSVWPVILSIPLFVAWHPLQAFTIGPPWSAMFLEPWFLSAVAIAGVMLVRIYLVTRSVWPCALAHWLLVTAWKLIFGGPLG